MFHLENVRTLPSCGVNIMFLRSLLNHSYDILGARMLWKPKEARIL
jgi:hypothetical protein